MPLWRLCGSGSRVGCFAGSLLVPSWPSVGGLLFCALVHPVVYAELHPSAGLLELVVVADRGFCVDDHPPNIFNQDKKLGLRLFCPTPESRMLL